MKTLIRALIAGTLPFFLAACASTGEADAPTPVAVAAEPRPPAYVAGDVLGAAPSDLDALLGVPALSRKEGQGEYRRYALKACSLIVILYPDETNEIRAAHIEATALSSAEEKPDLEDCLAEG
jgi:hypothetical protein